VIHVEAGLRSFDWNMPEEINRVVTDRLSDVLFITEPSARENLLNEGVPPSVSSVFWNNGSPVD
jgi:UDP-N-acetylglucosamine 2-epimerase (non-hydrolysing)